MSLFCLLWKICVSSANDHILQSFKVSLWWKKKFLSVSWTVVGRFQTGNNDAFFNFDSHNSRLNEKRIIIPRKNVGLWLKFTLFESYKNILIPISLMPPLVAFFSINSCNWSYCKFSRKIAVDLISTKFQATKIHVQHQHKQNKAKKIQLSLKPSKHEIWTNSTPVVPLILFLRTRHLKNRIWTMGGNWLPWVSFDFLTTFFDLTILLPWTQ